MSKLTALPNIGEKLALQLEKIGIDTSDKLLEVGGKEAWLRILARDPSACFSRLSALEGAIQGIRWHNLPPEVKADLKQFYRQHKLTEKKNAIPNE